MFEEQLDEDEIAEVARQGDTAKRAELGRRRSEMVEQLRKAAGEEPAA